MRHRARDRGDKRDRWREPGNHQSRAAGGFFHFATTIESKKHQKIGC